MRKQEIAFRELLFTAACGWAVNSNFREGGYNRCRLYLKEVIEPGVYVC